MSTDTTTPKSRVIVLCFDGTSNQFSAQNTNVVKLYGLLDKRCPLDQLVYYQPGVGTYFNPGVVSPALTWIAEMADEAFAWYLNEHVMGGYEFLMQNYRDGDRICIFGFSRGAYTARALAGFLYKIGLLPRDNPEQVSFAYKLYKREDDAGIEIAKTFKQTFCMPITIDFLGVWDTVASVGIIYGRSLPFTSANSAVRIFRHALSLDEHRARFQPNLFHRESPQDADRRREDPSLPVESESTETEPIPPVREVWFSGCHADIGGSSVPDVVRYSLSDITLQWMVKQVVLSKCGIKFDEEALQRADINISKIPKQDVMANVYDQLKIKWIWWLSEFVPIRSTWQEPDGTWKSAWRINFGRGRKVRDPHPDFHVSVRERMENADLKYKPRATWTEGSEQYVD